MSTESPTRFAGGDLLARYPEYTYTRLKAALDTLERANSGEGAERAEFLRTKADLFEHLFEYDSALECLDKAIEGEPLTVGHLMARGVWVAIHGDHFHAQPLERDQGEPGGRSPAPVCR